MRKAAIEFALKLFEFTNQTDFRGFGDTKNQLERAAVSISNNVAEGFERGSNKELIYFPIYLERLGRRVPLDAKTLRIIKPLLKFRI